MDNFCGKCNKSFSRSDANLLPCNGFCKKTFHRACCKEMSEYDMNLIKTKRNLLYLCEECVFMPEKLSKALDAVLVTQKLSVDLISTAFETKFKDLVKQFNDLKELIISLHSEINNSNANNLKNQFDDLKKFVGAELKIHSVGESHNAVASQVAELRSLLSDATAVAASASPSPGRVDDQIKASAVNVRSSAVSAAHANIARLSWAQAAAGLSPSASPYSNLPTPANGCISLPVTCMPSVGVPTNASAGRKQNKAKNSNNVIIADISSLPADKCIVGLPAAECGASASYNKPTLPAFKLLLLVECKDK
ncbi:uncharacterized protein LOC118735112, partial [Rhagoletis pomonella]|uniref:uncharacterized protein LOC118735112 n=1 Tax=Rhagoletis pomonella TaxID=28610 RepID=UPI00178280AB